MAPLGSRDTALRWVQLYSVKHFCKRDIRYVHFFFLFGVLPNGPRARFLPEPPADARQKGEILGACHAPVKSGTGCRYRCAGFESVIRCNDGVWESPPCGPFTVEPSSSTRAVLTQLKVGEKVFGHFS